MVIRSVTLALAILGSTTAVSARTWYVTPGGDGDVPTIQAAINSSASGDSVVIAAGTYDENLEIPVGLDLVLRGESGAEATVVDGGTRASVLIVRGTGIVEDLTLRNGQANFGGGVFVEQSQALILRDNIIEDNSVGFSDFGNGGGIYLHVDTNAIIIKNNLIRNNFAGDAGGGVFLWGGFSSTPPELRENAVIDNVAELGGGGVSTGTAVVVGNLVAGNSAFGGGGIGVRSGGAPTIRNNTIVANTVTFGPSGAGIEVSAAASPLVTKNIVVNNRYAHGSRSGFGIYCRGNAAPTIECNLTWGNDIDEVVCGTIQSGNFSADPLFCDISIQNFHLQPNSPCLPENNLGCALIGAFSTGCASVAVERQSWTEVKSRYR